MFSIVYTTTGTEAEALTIAETLLNEHLIACANYFPIRSVYRWQGAVQHDQETGMILKTRTEHVERIVERIRALHSYEVPCVISAPLGPGNPVFLEWIKAETATGGP